MNKSLPDKWVRKAIWDVLDDLSVNGHLIPCYDSKVTLDVQKDDPQHYILMTTQTNDVDKRNKCEWFWESTILLDIITSFPGSGNTGSRLLADDIVDSARSALQGLTLDVGSGLEVVKQDWEFPADKVTDTNAEVIFRKFIRLELRIK